MKTVLCVFAGVGLSLALLDVDDVYWSAFTAFMVTRVSARETAWRGLLRLIGTIAGGAAGLLLARFTVEDAGVMIAAMAAIGFVATVQFQISRHSYAWMFCGMTALLAVTVSLATPETIVTYVAVRIAEIGLGVIGCSVVSWVFVLIWPHAEEPAKPVPPTLSLWRGWRDEAWLTSHWLVLGHAARGALALALLPPLWRAIELQDFPGTSVTSFMVMLVPAAPVLAGREDAARDRGVHRLVGCTLGGLFALACLPLIGDDMPLWMLCLGVGVWVAAWIQNGTTGISYCGSQFALAFLVTLVQGNGAPDQIAPALERFEGILIGLLMLGFVAAIWPLHPPAVISAGPTPDRAH